MRFRCVLAWLYCQYFLHFLHTFHQGFIQNDLSDCISVENYFGRKYCFILSVLLKFFLLTTN
jgi:hypothetical protein